MDDLQSLAVLINRCLEETRQSIFLHLHHLRTCKQITYELWQSPPRLFSFPNAFGVVPSLPQAAARLRNTELGRTLTITLIHFLSLGRTDFTCPRRGKRILPLKCFSEGDPTYSPRDGFLPVQLLPGTWTHQARPEESFLPGHLPSAT